MTKKLCVHHGQPSSFLPSGPLFAPALLPGVPAGVLEVVPLEELVALLGVWNVESIKGRLMPQSINRLVDYSNQPYLGTARAVDVGDRLRPLALDRVQQRREDPPRLVQLVRPHEMHLVDKKGDQDQLQYLRINIILVNSDTIPWHFWQCNVAHIHIEVA